MSVATADDRAATRGWSAALGWAALALAGAGALLAMTRALESLVMTHHRDRFERVYALTEQVAPAHLIREHDDSEADRFLIKKEVGFSGLSRLNRTSDSYRRGEPDNAAKKLLERMLADCAHGRIADCRVIKVLADHGECSRHVRRLKS